jgi:DNA repair exonuclease SbcCD ATPase subunit
MFDRQTKERLGRVEARLDAYTEQFRNVLIAQTDELSDLLSQALGEKEELLASQRSMLALIERLQTKVDELEAALEEARNTLPASISMLGGVPLHVSEDEEEAKWQLENGLIDKKMYDDILQEVGLMNTSIEFG